MRRGLVIGKFYPPHRGHKHLIDTALAAVDQLTVVVCQRPDERPEGALRAAWLREIHPAASVLLVDDTLGPDDSKAWAEFSIDLLGFRPDAVFTSEDYGEPFAGFLGCRHVLVDRARLTVPVSGTAVRANPLGWWEYLEPPVRGFYARRVAIVGAESTGKTTLARALAAHFRTAWVAEYGREYSEQKLATERGYRWASAEFEQIARVQCEREDAAAREADRVLVCDTDAFATSIWHRRYMGSRSPAVEAIATRHRRPDLYLLSGVDAPFVQDGTRDGEAIREWMHETFVEELTAQDRPFELLSGPFDERFRRAVELVVALIPSP